MRIITSEDIRAHISMSDLIQEVRRAYLLLKDGKSITPLRTVTDPGGNRPKLLYKPSYDCTNGQMAVKLLSQLRQTSPEGYPTIQGLIVLFDGIRNTILSVMDGRHVTALRTGAASGLASALLSRKDSSVLAVFGAGAQAYTQIQAVLEVRDIRKVIVFDIIPAAVDRLITYFSSLKKGIVFVRGIVERDLSEADIVCTVTNSKVPLFEAEYLKPGVHINAIGSFCRDMRELPDGLFAGSSLYVDQQSACFAESGDIIWPLSAGLINDGNYRGEIVDLLTGRIQGRDSDERRTVFKSVGVATQDLTVAQLIYETAERMDFGFNVNL